MARALEDIRVLEAGQGIAGPLVGTFLGDMGAEIIKCEEISRGDMARGGYPPLIENISPYRLFMGRNKKSFTLNLMKPKGQDIFKELVKMSDIIIENFRPGTMDEWGLGYEELRKVNPGIIMLSNSLYGGTGPFRKRPGVDWMAQAHAGIMSVTGDADGPATIAGTAVGSYFGGLFGIYGVLSALHYKDKTGLGQWVDSSMFESAAFTLADRIPLYTRLGIVSGRRFARGATPVRRSFSAKDGDVFIALMPNRRPQLLNVLGREDLLADPRFQVDMFAELGPEGEAELERLIEEWCGSKTREEVVTLMLEQEILAAPVLDVAELVNDPQYIARVALVEVDHPQAGPTRVMGPVPKLSLTPARVVAPAPILGQHNDYVFGDLLKMSKEQVEELKTIGVV